MTVIHASHLTRRFAQHIAVDALELSIKRGEIYGLLGHNGAGKTTTVRLLNGLLLPDAGHARVLGLDPVTEGEALRRRVGVLTETPSLEERLSAHDNLHFHAELHGLPRATLARRVRECLEQLDLGGVEDQRVATFSKGMKQRLAIARALLHEPEVLYFDEPTGGLDPVSAQRVQEILLSLARHQGCTVVLCTHDLNHAQHLCDRVSILRHGAVIASGTLTQLIAQLGLHASVRIEIDPQDAARVLNVVEQHVASPVTLDGSTVQIERLTRREIPRLLHHLIGMKVAVYGVAHTPPTLEDVYFHLHQAAQEVLEVRA